ncbi:unnamed protein product [Heligmosomoides polygyrus]|uniref:HTH_7 domain-containing protein n=1 Tax=Heligmosomoides polygyrus TaxID=6339 RepID=A0A183G1L9_HELPZ|nr:unnamed protein product [Heligmosomoides polygyrus]
MRHKCPVLIVLAYPPSAWSILFDLLNGFAPHPTCICAPPPCAAAATASATSISSATVVGGGPPPMMNPGYGGGGPPMGPSYAGGMGPPQMSPYQGGPYQGGGYQGGGFPYGRRYRRPVNGERLLELVQEDPLRCTRELAEELECSHTTIAQQLRAPGKRCRYGAWIQHELSGHHMCAGMRA